MRIHLMFVTAIFICISSCTNSTKFKIVSENNVSYVPTALNKPEIYYLTKHAVNADFNYKKIDSLYWNMGWKSAALFEPVQGKYHYYQFLATVTGETLDDNLYPTTATFHDILIIKTDNNKKILDAFQYTLEWAEPPAEYDLYRLTAKGVQLTDCLDLKDLRLKRFYCWDKADCLWEYSGAIRMK